MKLFCILIFFCIAFNSNAQYGSKQKVFKSFTILNDELEKSQQSQKRSVDRLYFLLFKSLSSNSNDTLLASSDSVRQKTTELINYINTIKVLLIVKAEKLEKAHVVDHDTIINLRYISSLDDYSTPTMILIGDNRWTPASGQYSASELKEKLVEYEDFLLSNLAESDKNTEMGIEVIEHNEDDDYFFDKWEVTNFYNIPLGGVITYLSKIQLDVRMSEAALVTYWLQK